MASSSASSHSKSSRFSTTLGRAFKFSSKDKESRPPPLPPKDAFYLRNRSLASLSPDSLSIPGTPLSPHSPQSQRLSPDMHMNQSSMSLVSSAASGRSFSPADAMSTQKKEKGSGFFKFGKRSPKPRSTKSPPATDALPPPPTEDDGISLPWNFQHNIHVDEGFTGLPPSWTTSLAKAGFTEEEIADIQNRRTAGSRSPGSQYLFTDRPASPAYSSSNAPVLTHPTPRTTSLPRQFSDASLRSRADTAQRSSPPSLPPLHTSTTSVPLSRLPPQRQFSTDQSSTQQDHPSSSASIDSHVSNGGPSFGQDAALRALGTVSPTRAADVAPPSTPPRRAYHVTNEVSVINSPPPSYTNFNTPPRDNANGYPLEKQSHSRGHQTSQGASVDSTPRSQAAIGASSTFSPETTPQKFQRPRASTDASHERSTSSSSSNYSPQQQSQSDIRIKRLTALPPRLSLHTADDSSDLSTWGEALLSGISTASETTPNTSTFAAAQDAKLLSSSNINGTKPLFSTPTNNAYYARAKASSTRTSPPNKARDNENQRLKAPTRPIPPVLVPNGRGGQHSGFNSDEDEDGLSSSWVEPASTARYDPDATTWDEPESAQSEQPTPASDVASPLWSALAGIVRDQSGHAPEIYSAALSESCSPTLPLSPTDAQKGRDVLMGRVPQSQPKPEPESDQDESLLRADEGARVEGSNRDSSRSSTSTVTGFSEHAAIVRHVSIARRAGAYVIDHSKVGGGARGVGLENGRSPAEPIIPRTSPPAIDAKHPPSPLSSNFGSEEGSASGSGSSSSLSHDHPTPTTEPGLDSPLLYYLDSSPSPDPTKLSFGPNAHLLVSATDTFGGIKEPARHDVQDEEEEEEELVLPLGPPVSKPKIIISSVASPSTGPLTAIPSSGTTPLSPFQRYRGWLSAVVAPLEEFIDEAVDPREYYLDLQEIAEGESGSVYAARLSETSNLTKLKLPPLIKAQDSDDINNGRTKLVAIKSVAILPTGSPKLVDLERELSLMKGLWHANVLSMDAVYVDLVEDTLWIRMELMERSLADIVGLVVEGLTLQDRVIARFASDVLQALEYLQKHRIAHRDVRSDNLLLNTKGILKLADFSNAVQVTRENRMRSDLVGVVYWQAPEVRTPPYDALKVDIWSLGATIWEMAEAEPPFADTQQISDRWPPLRQPQLYSPAFHDFLRLCSEPPSSRPTPSELKQSSFINNACGRAVIIQLLSQCMAIEQAIREREVSQLSE
ncbi:Serine/threonine-protein kinase pakA [Hypsizygus marmoreus]|uniref:Serine/threonine-protein kinase pakA n=1 Tax=Hypsizygus marmoreus TaxID=39966 RepID=A0A369JQW6_HYPMA|nr:Serine/threonine-protein kinase pakA [Hypsizygus marmoreus]